MTIGIIWFSCCKGKAYLKKIPVFWQTNRIRSETTGSFGETPPPK